jgi:tetratricopeptide (TPR) repeat protein
VEAPIRGGAIIDRTFSFDGRALARLAQATSSVIAWLLIIPDAIGLLPIYDSITPWFLRLLGLWISAAVLWFVSFLGILHLVGFLSQGVSVQSEGIKLWRFAKLIPWEHVEAIEVEPQFIFSKLFSLHPAARRLTIFETPHGAKKFLAAGLVTHNVPSFLFSAADFDALVEEVSSRKFAFVPQSQHALLLAPAAYGKLRKTHKLMAWQRVLITFLIGFGLITVLGRKAVVNYSYNFGNKCLARGDFVEAKNRYKTALSFEPTFPYAWDNLARAEFNLGDLEQARKHWLKALFFKPDYVEPKISLALISLHQRQFEQAKDYIDSALNLSPLNANATLIRANYNIRLGHAREAMADARAVLAQLSGQKPDPQVRYMAICLLAQSKLKLGDAKTALNTLSILGPLFAVNHGENLSFRLMVESQCLKALKRLPAAENLARAAVSKVPTDAEYLVNLAEVLMAEGKDAEALACVQKATAFAPADPYCYISCARLALKEKQPGEAKAKLEQAIALPAQDAQSLAKSAQIALALGDRDMALNLARRALKAEPRTSEALVLVNALGQVSEKLSD